ncbi:MAG: STAS domain-containing protein [Phycisphaerae bacterium]|nr:STAS domain-containing protein [Phycisphaerae bacterium]
MPPVFHPKIFTVFSDYTRRQFGRDFAAGIPGGFVALPLALSLGLGSIDPATASAAGISPPVAGLITAIVAGFLISALGGTRASIGGPTAAFIVIVASIAQRHGFGGLAVATIMAGAIMIAMGALKMGAMIKYIPYPVTTGFTAGIGVTIFTGQIKDALGLHPINPGDPPIPPEFVGKISWYLSHAGTIHWPTAAMSALCIAVLVLWPRFVSRRIPSPIVVLVLSTVAVQLFGMPLETIHDRFGSLPTSLPMPRLPSFEWASLPSLVGPAFTIAMLAAIESLLCAVVADGMVGSRHRPNTELIAQGIANIASPLFGGIPATGAIARTATNIQSGGRTPLAGIVHALTLLGILLAVGFLAEKVPLCALAAVLVVVAWNMSEIERVAFILKGPRQDALVLATTLLLTVFTDLTVAVGVGLVLASLLFMKRMADVTNIDAVTSDQASADGRDSPLKERNVPPEVEIYDINGPFFFGAAYKLRETLDEIGAPPKILIINMPNVLAVDATGLHALHELKKRCARDGTRLILAGVHAQPVQELVRSGLLDIFGDENLLGTIDEALERARAILGTDPMETRARIHQSRET